MPGIRGCLSAMLKVLGHVGVLLSYIAGTYLNWRQSALLVAVAPSMLFLGTLFIPETPSYLVLNGKDEEAASSLQWLRGEQVDIRHELQVPFQIFFTSIITKVNEIFKSFHVGPFDSSLTLVRGTTSINDNNHLI